MNKLPLAKKKKVSRKYLKEKAWNAFSVYIRTKNTDPHGFAQCYTCYTIKHWKQMDAGHGIAGRNNAVLFLEQVVKPQCRQCNRFKHGRLEIFTRRLIEEIGIEEYDKLVFLSKQVVIYNVSDFYEVIERYKET